MFFGTWVLKSARARLAQPAERKALNLVVVGSSPTVGVWMPPYCVTSLTRRSLFLCVVSTFTQVRPPLFSAVGKRFICGARLRRGVRFPMRLLPRGCSHPTDVFFPPFCIWRSCSASFLELGGAGEIRMSHLARVEASVGWRRRGRAQLQVCSSRC